MLLTLNDDCLFLICNYLNVTDHIELLQTCYRLRNIMADFYQQKRKVTLDYNTLHSFNTSERTQSFLFVFQDSIQHSVEEISIGIDQRMLHYLDCMPLSKITSFDIYLDPFAPSNWLAVHAFLERLSTQLKTLVIGGCNSMLAFDYTMPNLTSLEIWEFESLVYSAKNFPELSKLCLHDMTVNNEISWDFKNLTELELINVSITQKQLQKIFCSLPLKKLFMHDFCGRFDGISECQTLQEIVLNRSFIYCSLEELTKLKNLRKVVYVLDKYKKTLHIPVHPRLAFHTLSLCVSHQIPLNEFDLSTKLKSLKHLQLYLYSWDYGFLTTDCDAVLKLLQICKNLRTLYTRTPSWIAAQILERAVHIFKDRAQPIQITCCLYGESAVREFSRCNPNMEIDGIKRLKKLQFNDGITLKLKTALEEPKPKIQYDWLAANDESQNY